jgi:hypothetical protein
LASTALAAGPAPLAAKPGIDTSDARRGTPLGEVLTPALVATTSSSLGH